MKKCTDEKFWSKLTKKEIIHLVIDAGIKDVDGLNLTVASHEEHRKKGDFEPCWDCKSIARKLNMIEDQ